MGINFIRTLIVLCVAAIGLCVSGCGPECGDGTFERDDLCVPADDFLTCAVGFRANGNVCEPDPDWKKTACNPKSTRFNVKTGLCDGVGTTTSCTQQCPAAVGGKICISGQAFDWASFITNSGDLLTSTKIKKGDGAVLQIFDLLDFITKPSPVPVKNGTTTVYNDQGCFLFKDLVAPFTGLYILVAEDEKSSDDKYAFLGNAVFTTATENVTNAEGLGLSTALVKEWDKKVPGILSDGSWIFWFRTMTGKGLDGATATREGKPPPWDVGTAFYMADDPGKAPYFISNATKTGKSGLMGVHKPALKSYSATKPGCKFLPGSLGSAPGRILFGHKKIECL